MRRVFLAACAISMVGAWLACRDPTEMLVRVTTDFDCNQLGGNQVGIRFGSAFLPSGPVSSTSIACANGYAGTLVLTPSGKGDHVTIEVMAAIKPASLDADGSCTEGAPGCIHARRSLSYLANTPLTVPISLSSGCAGVQCDLATQTCFEGQCVSSTVDPTQCDPTNCGINPPQSPLAAECGDMSGLQAGSPYPTAAGCAGRTVVSTEHGLAIAPANRLVFPLDAVPLNGIVVDKDNVAYVTTAGGSICAIELDQGNQRWCKTLQPTPIQNLVAGTQVIASTGKLYAANETEVHVFNTLDGSELEPPVTMLGVINSDVSAGPGGRLLFANTSGQVESMETVPFLAPGPTADFPHGVYGATYLPDSVWVGDALAELWAVDAPTMFVPSGPAYGAKVGTFLYAEGGPDGLLRLIWGDDKTFFTVGALDPSNNALQWSQPVNVNATATMAVTHDGTAWVNAAGTLYTFGPDGTPGASFVSYVRFAGFDVDGFVYTEDGTSTLASYDKNGVARWTAPQFQDPLSEMVVAKNGVLVGLGTDANVYVYKP